jgi:hypothetical protein
MSGRESPLGGISRPKFRTPGQMPGGRGSVGAFGRTSRVRFLDLLFGLIAGSGTGGRADGTTDDRSRGPCDRATDQGAGCAATQGAGARTGLVVAFGRLAGDRATDGADGATDDRSRRATHGHTGSRATERADTGAHGLGAAFLVLGGGAGTCVTAATLVQQIVIVGMIVGCGGVVIHWDLLVLG